MADSRIYRILEALQTKVAGDFSGGFSALDMTGKTVIGTVFEPPYLPFGCVYFTEYTTDHGPTLGRYQSRAKFEVYLFCAGTSPSDRVKRAMNLASDAIGNITANRFLGLSPGTIDDVLCKFTATDGEKYGLENAGIAYIEVETPFKSDGGI